LCSKLDNSQVSTTLEQIMGKRIILDSKSEICEWFIGTTRVWL